MPADQSFPVRFTQPQRKVIAELSPELTGRLKLDETNQRTIPLSLAELKRIHDLAAVGRSDNGMERNSLRHVCEISIQAVENFQGIGAIPPTERIYQFKITLTEIKPPIWRRIQVRDCTLNRLHEYIQLSFGWWNYHLHQFDIRGERYGDPYLLNDGFDDFECVDSTVTKVSKVVPKDGSRFSFDYEYDFGDGWVHKVLFEGCMRATPGERYPLCLEGARACPPEDVGGAWGYADYLDAMADPRHERHEECMQWRGSFDPEEFEVAKVTRKMRRGMPTPQEE